MRREAFHTESPTSWGSVGRGLQHQQQGPNLEGRKGKLQAGVLKGQVAVRVALLQEVAAGEQEGLREPCEGRTPASLCAPHSQDGFLNRQRRVQPAVDVAAVGLVQPEHQRTALEAGLCLRREAGGGQGRGGLS